MPSHSEEVGLQRQPLRSFEHAGHLTSACRRLRKGPQSLLSLVSTSRTWLENVMQKWISVLEPLDLSAGAEHIQGQSNTWNLAKHTVSWHSLLSGEPCRSNCESCAKPSVIVLIDSSTASKSPWTAWSCSCTLILSSPGGSYTFHMQPASSEDLKPRVPPQALQAGKCHSCWHCRCRQKVKAFFLGLAMNNSSIDRSIRIHTMLV